MALTSERPLLLYVKVMDYSLGAILAQKNDEGHEHAIYYLNRTLIGAEFRHNPIEKECLAVIFAIQKRRHYLVGQTIHAIFRVNPLCILMTKPGSLNSRLAKWAILLSQYDILFVPQKAVKYQAFVDFLVAHPVLGSSKLHEDIPNEIFESNMISEDEVWQMFFDGASKTGPQRQDNHWCRGGIYLATKSYFSSGIFIDNTLF